MRLPKCGVAMRQLGALPDMIVSFVFAKMEFTFASIGGDLEDDAADGVDDDGASESGEISATTMTERKSSGSFPRM